MKIELELPYVDDELSIKITVKKSGEVVVGEPKKSSTPATASKAQSKKKETSPAMGGNFMNADF